MPTPSRTASTSRRPIGLRARRDLEFFPQLFGNRRYWVVKDPVALRYFQLREEEYSILRLLDGRTSLAGMVDRFQKKFAPRRLTESRLAHFLGTPSFPGAGSLGSPRSGTGVAPTRKKPAGTRTPIRCVECSGDPNPGNRPAASPATALSRGGVAVSSLVPSPSVWCWSCSRLPRS